MAQKRACIVVLGDIERSPRMKYHSLSLSKLNYHVDVVAYLETPLSSVIRENKFINVTPVKSFQSINKYCPRIVAYFLKTFIQSLSLLFTLMTLNKPDLLLLQNPPSIPTLPVIWFYSVVRGVKVIIDWHNYGFTILSLTLSPDHILVKICRWAEGFFGAKANYNLCVSRAMSEDLKKRWNIKAAVLYDRPAPFFNSFEPKERCEFLKQISLEYPQFSCLANSNSQLYQISYDKSIRPFILISSTSWTEDEDFSILLNALDDYNSQAACNENQLPDLICVITGKGPLKSYYEHIIKTKQWKKVNIVLPWLTSEDYPKMIASADIGVSLHKSSSNLDLPMKIIDMFGSCVPVLAINYPCLHELVKEGINGMVFENSTELAEKLIILLTSPRAQLTNMRENLIKSRRNFSWEIEWSKVVKPLFI